MIQEESHLKVADNTGAKRVKCFRVLGGSKRRYAGPGDVIVCSVREVDPGSSIKKGDVVKCVVVRTRRFVKRADGSTMRSDSNAAVLIDDKGQPKGTRVFGTVFREVRDAGYIKICSLAPEVM